MRLDGARLRLSASDVANFVACGHQTRLDLLHARGQVQPPRAFDVGFEDLVARGEAHEGSSSAALRGRLARGGDLRRTRKRVLWHCAGDRDAWAARLVENDGT